MINKEIFQTFLSGGYTEAEALSTALANRRGLPVSVSDGYLTYSGAESICSDLTLPKTLWAALLQVHRANTNAVAPEVLDQLRRCLLLDSLDCLTQHGYYKMVAGLPLKEQVAALALSYGEQFVVDSQLKTEEYVRASYEALGYRCVHDEGRLLSALMDSILRPDSAFLKSLISSDSWYTPDNPCYEAMIPYRGNFQTIAPNGSRFVASHRKLALLEIMQKASAERIATGHDLHSQAFANLPSGAGHSYSLELLLELFTCIGAKRLYAILCFHLDYPECGHGLPDLIAFKKNELIMVEVKRSDKLMFHQARTLHMLAALPKDVISDIRIVKVVA